MCWAHPPSINSGSLVWGLRTCFLTNSSCYQCCWSWDHTLRSSFSLLRGTIEVLRDKKWQVAPSVVKLRHQQGQRYRGLISNCGQCKHPESPENQTMILRKSRWQSYPLLQQQLTGYQSSVGCFPIRDICKWQSEMKLFFLKENSLLASCYMGKYLALMERGTYPHK